MPAERTTAETILAAAQRSIRRRGPQKLSLSAVAEEAGVSRPTVYRWFPTKTLLLAAITAYEVEQFDTGLQALADQYDDPSERFDASLRYMVTYLDETIGADAISADPAFSLQSLADSLGPHIESVAGVLGDALDQIPAVGAGALTARAGRRDAAAGRGTRTTSCPTPTPIGCSRPCASSPGSPAPRPACGAVPFADSRFALWRTTWQST